MRNLNLYLFYLMALFIILLFYLEMTVLRPPSKIVNFLPLRLTDGPFISTANLINVDGRFNREMIGLTVNVTVKNH